MTDGSPKLDITTAPFTQHGLTTNRVMLEVLLSLVPLVIAAVYFFGFASLIVIGTSAAGAMATEWLLMTERKGLGSLRDNTALLTGVLLGLTLPPSIPLWMAFLGGASAIGLGKAIWGGLGQNAFNPALVGRAFLQASFPEAMMTWTKPGEGLMRTFGSDNLAAPFMKSASDVVTSASPLGLSKFEDKLTDILPLMMGNTSGSLGETAGFLIILCGIYLAFRRVFDWRLPVSTLLTVAVFAGILHLINPGEYPSPQFMLASGGLLFGAVFMVTDPVTTPITPRGAWIFGFGVGILVVLIRLFGGLPEGVMYSILLMNSATPLINRYTQPRQFGG